MKAAEKLKEILEKKGAKKVVLADLAREDMHEAVEDAFRYDKIVLAASSYHLKERNYQNRKIAIIQNGSWAPSAEKTMKNILQEMKDIDILEDTVTIKSTMKKENVEQIEKLADKILGGE